MRTYMIYSYDTKEVNPTMAQTPGAVAALAEHMPTGYIIFEAHMTLSTDDI